MSTAIFVNVSFGEEQDDIVAFKPNYNNDDDDGDK
jgi:hypothetical protein